MDDQDETGNSQYTFSKDVFRQFLNWVFLAVISFVSVIIFYQLIVAIISLSLGYETHIHFFKVDSLPHTIDYWSSNRVIALYFIPPVFLLLVSVSIMGVLLFGSPKLTLWTWFTFWFMVFSMLFSTTLFCLSFYSFTPVTKGVFQGFAVIVRWFGLAYAWSVIFVSISIIINFAVGFACSYILIHLAPADYIVRKGRRYPQRIVLISFLYTLLLVFPVAMLIAFPDNIYLFIIMFCQAILWLPGLLNIHQDALRKRRSRKSDDLVTYSPLMLFGFIPFIIILIRVFLA